MSDFKLVKLLNTPVVISAGSIVGPTIAAGGSTYTSGPIEIAAGSNITLSTGASAITIHGASGGAGGGGAAISAGTNIRTSGTVNFSNSNGITFGMDAGGVVTASHNAYTGNTTQFAGTGTTYAGTNINATVGLNSNGLAMSLSAAAGGGGNTLTISGSNGTLQTNGLSVVGSNGISAYTTGGNSFVVAMPNQTDLTNHAHAYSNATTAVSSRVVQIAASNTTFSGDITITGSNGINVGSGAGGQIIVSLIDSHHVDAMMFAGNNAGTAFSNMTSGTVTLNFAGAISGSQNGNALTISAPAQSVQTQNSVLINGGSGAFTLAGTNTGATNCSVTVNSSGVSVNVPANSTGYATSVLSTGLMPLSYSSGFQTATLSGTFAPRSNVIGTGSISTVATAGSLMTGSAGSNGITLAVPAYVTAAAGGGDGYNIVSLGTAGTTGTAWSSLSASVGINGSGAVTVSQNNSNQLVINAPAMSVLSAVTNCTLGTTGSTIGISCAAGGTGGADGYNPIFAGGKTFNSTENVSFGDRVGMSFITSNGSIAISKEADIYMQGFSLVGNTAGTNASTYTSEGPIYLSGGANVTLSGNNNTIVVSAAAGGGAQTLSIFQPQPLGNNTTFSSLGQSSLYLQKLHPEQNYSFSAVERYASVSFASSTNNASVNYSIMYGLYSVDAGTNSTRMTLLASSQLEMRAAFSSNTSAAYSIIQGTGTNASNSAGTALYSNITAGRHMYFPFASSFAAGQEYWFGMNVMSASTVTSTPLRLAFLEQTCINNVQWGKIKGTSTVASNASFVGDFAQGVLSAQTAAMPSTLANSQLTNQVSLGRMYLQFDNL